MAEFIDVGGARLWSETTGASVPVLLSNGGPGCCDYLEPVAPLFGNARVTRWEPRGCGRASGGPPFTIADCFADMEAIRAHLGVESWIVAGHSWGADLSLLYALEYPTRVRGLVCISGGRLNNDRDWHATYSAGRDAGLEADLDYAFPPNMAVNADLNRETKRVLKRAGLFRDLSRLACPALFIYGERDIRPSWPVEQVAALMPAARFELVAGAGHNLWLTHARELGGRLNGFMASCASSDS